MKKTLIIAALISCLFGCSDQQSNSAQTSSSSSSSSSSGGFSSPICSEEQIAMIPLFHNPPNSPDPLLGGLNVPEKFIENNVLACQSFLPTKASIIHKISLEAHFDSVACTLEPQFVWSIGNQNQLSGLKWSNPIDLAGLEQTFQIPVSPGKVFYGCAKLPIKDAQNRACLMSCENTTSEFSFWGNTDEVTGLVKDPPELEPLSISPTAFYAGQWGNDQRSLGIYFEWVEK